MASLAQVIVFDAAKDKRLGDLTTVALQQADALLKSSGAMACAQVGDSVIKDLLAHVVHNA